MKNIVIMPPNWLGDVVMAQPAMRAITTHFNHEQITVFGRGWLPELMPFLNLEHDNIQYVSELPKYADKVFLFPNSLRSAWQSFRSGAKERIGFRREGRGILLTHPYTSNVNLITQHHRGYYRDLLQQYGLEAPFDVVELKASTSALQQAKSLLEEKGINADKFVCVAPGAQFGGAKRYPAESYAEVLSALSQHGWDILVLGTPAERDIAIQCVSKVKGKYWNATGETTLSQALQLVAASNLVLCNDSGLMHVAAGLDVPTVTMFGATNPDRTSPSGKHTTVLYEPADCSPCLQRECTVQGHPCMINISSQMVTASCLGYLDKNS